MTGLVHLKPTPFLNCPQLTIWSFLWPFINCFLSPIVSQIPCQAWWPPLFMRPVDWWYQSGANTSPCHQVCSGFLFSQMQSAPNVLSSPRTLQHPVKPLSSSSNVETSPASLPYLASERILEGNICVRGTEKWKEGSRERKLEGRTLRVPMGSLPFLQLLP